MRPDNIFKGAGFKSALHTSIAFAIASVICGFAIYYVIQTALYHELKNQIKGEIVLFSKIYQEGGHTALIETVRSLENQYTPEPRLIGLFDKKNSKIGGNANLRPDFVGWKRVNQSITLYPNTRNYFAFSTNVGEMSIVVGRHLSIINPVLKLLYWLLIASGVTATVTALAIGYIASKRDTRKLNNIVDTLDAVSNGDSYKRIDTNDGGEQLDQIASQINDTLDKLSSLIETTKNTSTAIAHDLRSPINRASLILQDAQNAIRSGGEQAEYIRRAEEELSNVSDIFDTILRISRISSSSDKAGFALFSLSSLAMDMVETYQPVAEESNIKLVGKMDMQNSCALFGDQNMLRQALTNLIENAITYCPENSNICLDVYQNKEREMCIEVSDNGPGIPKESLSKVIDPFFRIESSRGPPGNGLGLALVQAIALKHQARLVLEDNSPGLRAILIFGGQSTIGPDSA